MYIVFFVSSFMFLKAFGKRLFIVGNQLINEGFLPELDKTKK